MVLLGALFSTKEFNIFPSVGGERSTKQPSMAVVALKIKCKLHRIKIFKTFDGPASACLLLIQDFSTLTLDILGHIILCCDGCFVHYKILVASLAITS